MKHGVDAGHRRVDGRRIADVADHALDVEPIEIRVLPIGLEQGAHGIARGEQGANDRRSDEAGCAGDEHLILLRLGRSHAITSNGFLRSLAQGARTVPNLGASPDACDHTKPPRLPVWSQLLGETAPLLRTRVS